MEIIKKYSVDTYLPLLPQEIVLAAKLREEEKLPSNLKILAPSPAVSKITSDKYETALWLMKNNIPVPQTSFASEPFSATHYFLKPRNGSGSQGEKIFSRTEFQEHVSIVNDKTAIIIQDICEPPEVTVDTFFDDRHDFTFALCRERVEIK